MRNKGKIIDRKIGMAVLFISALMTFAGCGKAEISGENSTKEATSETTHPAATPLDWETPVIELGEVFPLSEDIKDYISVEDDNYEGYILESTVDIFSPGEYEIRISGHEESFVFSVIVRDTTCPEMELLCGYDIVRPGSSVSADTIFASVSDNDPEYVYGFHGLELMTEEELSIPKTESLSYEYQENSEITRGEISKIITLPEEEGLYLVYAAVLDRSGNIVTSPVYFLVDGTGPQIKLRKEKVTVYLDQNYDFTKGVTLEDNVFPEEECNFWIDEKELTNLQDSLQKKQTGTYTLTYYAEDSLENTTKKVLTVTLAERPAPQESNTPQENKESQNNQTSVSTDSSYDLEMAQAAFAAVNEYRINNGLSALTWNDTLYENCKVRAEEISTSFSHTRPNGESCFTAFTVSYSAAGENIASGYTTAQSVTNGWWNSEGHKANMLSGSFSQAAIACYYANGRYHWVNLFIG